MLSTSHTVGLFFQVHQYSVFGFWLSSYYSRFAFWMKITRMPRNKQLVFTEKTDKSFFPKPYQLSLLLSCLVFPRLKKKEKTYAEPSLHSGPCCTRHFINMYQHSPCLWMLTRFSTTAFIFALQVQVWETVVECFWCWGFAAFLLFC